MHLEQTYDGTFFLGIVHFMCKNEEHFMHCIGLDPLVNFFLHSEQDDGIEEVLFLSKVAISWWNWSISTFLRAA